MRLPHCRPPASSPPVTLHPADHTSTLPADASTCPFLCDSVPVCSRAKEEQRRWDTPGWPGVPQAAPVVVRAASGPLAGRPCRQAVTLGCGQLKGSSKRPACFQRHTCAIRCKAQHTAARLAGAGSVTLGKLADGPQFAPNAAPSTSTRLPLEWASGSEANSGSSDTRLASSPKWAAIRRSSDSWGGCRAAAAAVRATEPPLRRPAAATRSRSPPRSQRAAAPPGSGQLGPWASLLGP